MTGAFFPHFIRTADEALGFVNDWAEQIAGLIVGDITAGAFRTAAGDWVRLDPVRVDFPASGTTLRMRFTFRADDINDVLSYSFDLRVTGRTGQLVHRWDKHPGHEREHGGPTHHHQHDDRGREIRIPGGPQSLARIAAGVARLNIDRTPN